MKALDRYPEPQDFVNAIGCPVTSEVSSRVVSPFRPAWTDAVSFEGRLEIFTISAPHLGIDFTFKDEDVAFDRVSDKVAEGPFLLTDCSFCGHEYGYEIYQGPIWNGLIFSDSLANVESKLGAPTRVGGGGAHFWELPEFTLTIQWNSPDKIRAISYWMNQN